MASLYVDEFGAKVHIEGGLLTIEKDRNVYAQVRKRWQGICSSKNAGTR